MIDITEFNSRLEKIINYYGLSASAFSEKISVQTIIILDKALSFIKRWDKEIAENVIWPEKSFKIKKLSPFIKFNLTKCKFIMKEVFV